jgi:hypothetical protein
MRRWFVLAAFLALTTAACGSDRAGHAVGGEVSSTVQLDPANVPEALRPLVPLAETWGIGDDVDRAELIARASTADREAVRTALAPHQARITAWLDSFGTDPMTNEAAAFMYLQLAVEEMRAN